MKTESTNAKKLHKGRAFNYVKNAEIAAKFIDPKTGKYYAKYTRLQACPVCSSKRYHEIFSKEGGTYVKCENCTMVFANPVFTDAALAKYYTSGDNGQSEVIMNESPFYREIYSRGLQAVTTFVKKPGTILDLGCGGGFFLDIAQEKKWQGVGVEPGLPESALARSKGHRVYTEPLEKITFTEQFSAITLWDVFEHLVDGSPYLKRFTKLLTKDGVVFMQIPNVGSLAARVMQEKCHMFGIGHVSLYNPDTIARMAKKNGYEILHLQTVISEAAVLENYLQYEDPYFGSADYRGSVLGVITPELIHKHKLGYKMQIVMRPIR